MPTRSPSGGCGRDCGRWPWPPAIGGPSGELLVDAVRDPTGLDMVDRRWALPAQTVAQLIATAREAAAAPGATAEQVLWTVWRASGLADRWYALSTRGAPIEPGGEGGRARQWRAEAADRDLDAMVVLFDAAARFVDRLPGARTEVFLDHVLGQDLPADSIAPSADRGEAVRLLTAHAAKGLEWDVVVLAGVQEGIWPDLRLRGSLLGSERLVDVLAGRAGSGVAAVVGQTSGAARRGTPPVLHGHHPGPTPARGHRGGVGQRRRLRR